AHNGKAFDEKKAQARMMIHHMPPPAPFRQIDTKQEIKKVSAHSSNKLFDLAHSLELDPKEDAGGYNTWINSMAGNKKAQKHFKKYNIQDVNTLEQLYLEIRPWIKSHPQINILTDRPKACPRCGIEDTMHITMKYKATNGNKYVYYRCRECKGMAKSRVPEEQYQKVDYHNA
ncbi:MAG: ribonuclease H-like domain-containing protein, partial [Candidatus Riesia sp.]|nr:ribonuclease H-like domain-containing protein [Candidatus Riesia sp.]